MKSLKILVNMHSPQSVFKEVKTILYGMFLGFDFKQLEKAFEDVKRLFKGRYHGYQNCNTRYHNIMHTTDTFLATARLIHGAMLQGEIFFEKNVNLGLISRSFS